MSDHIAHIAICNDAFLLAGAHRDIHPWCRTLMAAHRDAAHLGSITRYADKWSVDLLSWAHGQLSLPEAQRDAWLAQKVAFVLGSLTHRAADRLTKPITKCWKGPDNSLSKSLANESKIMQDLCVLREVFGHGEGDHAAQFPKPLLHAFESPGGTAFEQAFRALLTRALIGMHTIKPDPDHIQDWLGALFEARQEYPKFLEQYRELDRAWEPGKVKRYLTDMRFYDREDTIIQLARAAQHGTAITTQQVEDAHRATPFDQPTASRYARALSRSLDYLLAAGDIIEARIDTDTAKARLDIGVPELSLSV